jgi:hypothetical protein
MKKILFLLIFIIVSPYLLFAMKPEKFYKALPSDYNLEYTETKITTKDGYYINLWNIPVKSEKNTTIIICGGDAGNMSYYLNQASELHKNGINIILFDYRGFGKSKNFNIDPNLLYHSEFLIDFETALNYSKKIYPHNKIGTIGFSMGGYFPFITKIKMDFIIADSPLGYPKNVLERINKKNITLPINAVDINFKKEKTLIFIGENDRLIKMSDFKYTKENKINIVLYKGGHCEAFETDKCEFMNQLFKFLNQI